MRKSILLVAVVSLVAVACAESTVTSDGGPTSAATGSTSADPATCAQAATLLKPGTLTAGTDNPAYGPYFEPPAPKDSVWKLGYPPSGKGFESAVTYAVANEMGFSPSDVGWISLPYTQSYAPGEKDFDVYLSQVSYKPARTQAADFSVGYYDVTQALVATKGTPITSATSMADLKDYTIAAPLGSTSYDFIVDTIQPTPNPGTYKTLSDTVAALNAGQVDGIVVDYPTALYLADPYVQEVKDGVVVAQFTNPEGAEPEHFSFVLPKGSSLTPCVDAALEALSSNGDLQAITKKWLSEKTNVGEVPVFES